MEKKGQEGDKIAGKKGRKGSNYMKGINFYCN